MSLEQTRYRVDGGVSEIEVCARVSFPSISCPIQFPFVIGLATDHQSAGLCISCTMDVSYLKASNICDTFSNFSELLLH